MLIGNEPRLASPGFVETAAQRVLEQTGRRPAHPGALAQLVDLGFPFTLHEQGPLLAQGIPALTLTSGGERPPERVHRPARAGSTGCAWPSSAAPRSSSCAGSTRAPSSLPGTARYVYFGPRVAAAAGRSSSCCSRRCCRSWSSAVDLFARCRRRHIPLDARAAQLPQPASGSGSGRAILFELFALIGVWPGGAGGAAAARTRRRRRTGRCSACSALAVLAGLGWLVARPRLVPRGPVSATEELAGHDRGAAALWRWSRCSSSRRTRSR